MAALRLRAAALISAAISFAHFGSCGHTVVGAETSAHHEVAVDEHGEARVVVAAVVEVDACADVQIVSRLSTSTVAEAHFTDEAPLHQIRCEGPCTVAYDVVVRGSPNTTVAFAVTHRAECTDCDPARFLLYPTE